MLPEFFYLDHGIWGDEKVKVKHGASRSNKLGVVLELLQPEIVYSDGGAGVVFHLVCPRQVFRPLGNANILIYRLSPQRARPLRIFLFFGEEFRGSRNLVGIAIQLSDSEEEEFFVGYPMLISPEKFDFGIE